MANPNLQSITVKRGLSKGYTATASLVTVLGPVPGDMLYILQAVTMINSSSPSVAARATLAAYLVNGSVTTYWARERNVSRTITSVMPGRERFLREGDYIQVSASVGSAVDFEFHWLEVIDYTP